MNHFAVHLKLIQHCKLTILQLKKKTIKEIPAVAQCLKDLAFLWQHGLDPWPKQWIKCMALPQLRCRSQLWLRFNPWPGNFHIMWVHQKRKKKK